MTPTLISMFLWNCSSLNSPYWCSRLVLKSCKCVKYYFTTISYFLHLFPRCAQETPGMFWDPDWLLPKYGVAIVYFPFRIHMISFNSICRGHPNSAKSSLFPNHLKWRQFQLSLEWGQVGRDVSCYARPKVET